MSPETSRLLNEWALAIVLGGIGLFFLVMTYGALIASRRSGKYVSGVPCVGGLLIALGFLLSPCKWLALLGLLDYGIWEVLYMLLSGLLPVKRRENPKEQNDRQDPE